MDPTGQIYPTGHGRHVEEPSYENVPSPHVVHVDLFISFGVEEYVPAGQGTGSSYVF